MIAPSTTDNRETGARALTAQAIVAAVAQTFGVSAQYLTGPGRSPEMIDARKVAIWLLARRGLGPTTIGRFIGRDHSTVLHHQHIRLSDEQRIVLCDLARELGLPRRQPSGPGHQPRDRSSRHAERLGQSPE